jgi:hypothetical protein
MGKNVIWKDRAKAQLRAIDQPTALRILHALARLSGHWRGRRQNAIRITAVKHRREAYR